MTSSVQRHSVFVSEDDHGLPYVDDQEDPDGGWVKYDDIKHLLPTERQRGHDPGIPFYATLRGGLNDGLEETHLECRFQDGQKFAAAVIDDDCQELASLIMRAIEQHNAKPVEPPAPQWDINFIERIAREQGVFGGREGNTVTITGPIIVDCPALNRSDPAVNICQGCKRPMSLCVCASLVNRNGKHE